MRVPDGWRTVALNECIAPEAPICYGILMPGKHVPNGVPVVKVRDVERGVVQIDRLLRTDPSIDAAYKRSRLQVGDLLLSIRGSVGAVSVVPPILSGANITQDTARLRLSGAVDRRFVVHVLRSPSVQKYLRFHTVGQAVKGVNIRDVRRLPLVLPPIAEQRILSDRLDRWEHAIQTLSALIAAEIRLKRGLMPQLLTGNRRFARFAGAPWVDRHIGGLFEEVSRPIEWDEAAHYDLLSIRRRSGGVFVRGRVAAKSIKTKTLFDVHAGDLLISKMQAVHGAIALAGPEHEGMKVSASYVVLRPRSEATVQPSFFAYLTHLPQMYRAVLLSSYGVHIEKMTFNLEWYLRTPIRLPPSLEEQDAIAECLMAIDQEIDLLERERALLDLQRRAVTDRLLSGELRVPAGSDVEAVSA